MFWFNFQEAYMAFTKTFHIGIMMLAATLVLSSCAKKDSEFKGRKNASGATVVGDAAQNQRGEQAAQDLGLKVLDIQHVYDPVAGPQGLTIATDVIINTNVFEISTYHNSMNQEAVTQPFQIQGTNLTLVAKAVCASATCSPYYLLMTFTSGNKNVQQKILKKFFYFNGEGTESDYISLRGPTEFFTSMSEAIAFIDKANPVDDSTPE
jgi:hypothetical protein